MNLCGASRIRRGKSRVLLNVARSVHASNFVLYIHRTVFRVPLANVR